MKILFITQSLGRGGAERLTLEIANTLDKFGHITKIISLSRKNQFSDLYANLDIEFCDSFVSLSISKKNKIDLTDFLNKVNDFNPDIIHSNTYKAELVSRENTLKNICYFTHCHNNMPEFNSLGFKTLFSKNLLTKFYEKKRIEKKYYMCNNKFIVISKDSYNYYYKNLSSSLKNSIHFLPNAIDYNKFHYASTRKKTEVLKIVMVGHMADYKNQIFLIDVLEKLVNRNINTHLTLLGEWRNNGEKILAKAKAKSLDQYLSMPGIIDNVESELINQSIYVHSSLTESFGLVMIEAMASGLPVVCLDGLGNRDIIENDRNGYIISDANAELFADKILTIWNNEDKYQEMSQYAQEYAKQYNIKPYVEKLLVLYQNAIDEKH